MAWDETEFRRQLEGMTDSQISLALAKREGEFDKQNRRDLAEWVLRSRSSEREERRTSSANFWAIIAAIAAIIAAVAALIDAFR